MGAILVRVFRLLIILLVCFLSPSGVARSDDAVLLHGAAILTLDPDEPRAEAVLVVDGEIAAIGSLEECRRAKPKFAPEIALGGGTLTRGFFDGHARSTIGSRARLDLDLTGTRDEREMLNRVKARVAEAAPGEWVVGFGFDEALWPEGEWPHRSTLDATTELNPTVLIRYDGGAALANTSALHQAGVDDTTPDPVGGEFERDDYGDPTGILHLAAIDQVLAPRPAPTFEALLDAARAALSDARVHGVTSFVDVGGDVEVWRTLARSGALTARVHVYGELDGDLAAWQHARQRVALWREWIDLTTLHAVLDGTLDARSAALFEPYTDDATWEGILAVPADVLVDRVAAADAEGFQVALNATGDRAVALALDAFEYAADINGTTGRRHRVERLGVVREEDLTRFAALGVTASLQPALLLPTRGLAARRLGSERVAFAYPWRALLAADVPLALGSGFPSATLDPLRTLFAATTRASIDDPFAPPLVPEQALSLDAAWRAHTVGAARASFRDGKLGPLVVGSWADLVHLDAAPPDLVGRGILAARVKMTMVGGRIVHRVD